MAERTKPLGAWLVALILVWGAGAALAAPAPPANLLATPGNAQVAVSWGAVSGADSYNLYRATTEGGPYGAPLASGLTASSFTDSAAGNDTTWYYAATAVDGTGESAFSNEDPATPRAGTFVSGTIGGGSPRTTTWSLAGSPFVVVGDVEVRGTINTGSDLTSTLIVQPGVEVLFEPGTGLTIGSDSNVNAGHNGRLQATGASFTSNRTAPAAGDWRSIRFANTAVSGGANNFLDGCTVEWGGGGGAAGAIEVSFTAPELRGGTTVRNTAGRGVWVSDGAAVTITGGELEGGSAEALRVTGRSSFSLTGATLRGGTFPVRIDPNVVITALAANVQEGYPFAQAGVAVDGGVMGGGNVQSRSWPGGDLPFILLGDLEVRGTINTGSDLTSTLTVGPGATVRFAAGVGITVGSDANVNAGHRGRLLATGVTFTANEPTPTPGFWDGLHFADSMVAGASFLDSSVVEGAGGGGRAAAITVNATELELRGETVVRTTASGGLHLSGSTESRLTALGGEIQGGAGPAVRAEGRATLSLKEVLLRGGSFPAEIDPNVVLESLGGVTFADYGPEQDGVAVRAGVMGGGNPQTRRWPGGLDYIVLGDLEVRGTINTGSDLTSTLTIGSEGRVRFAAGAGLFIGSDVNVNAGHFGRLQATGVTFTANSPAPAAGHWAGIRFRDTARDGAAESLLDGCQVLWAGGSGAAGAVAVNRSHAVLRDTAVKGTATIGVWVSDAATLTFTGGEVEGGSGPAVRAVGTPTLTLQGITFRGGTFPVHADPNASLAGLAGNTAAGYPFEQAGIAVAGGLIGGGSPQTRFWPGGDLPYLVLGSLEVRGNVNTGSDLTSTLILGQGAELRFAAGARLSVGSDTNVNAGHFGQLRATGVTFTANSTAPAPGFWQGIHFRDSTNGGRTSNFLVDSAVLWAGGGVSAAVAINAAGPILLERTRVLGSDGRGVYLTASTASQAVILGCEIEGGSLEALRALDRSRLTLTGTLLRGGTFPVAIDPNTELLGLGGNTALGYPFAAAGIAVSAGVMGGGSIQSRTWPGGDLPYLVQGDLEVRGTVNTGSDLLSTLTLGEGAELRFAAGAGLFIGDGTGITAGHAGRLRAVGVTFTAAGESPAPGFWKGITFGNTTRGGGTETFVDASLVEWAGGGGAAGAVVVDRASVELRHATRVLGTATAGVFLTADSSSALVFTGGEIEGGADAALRAGDRSAFTLSGTALRGGAWPLRMGPNAVPTVLAGNTLEGYPALQAGIAVDGGVIGGGSVQTRVWSGDLPFIILGNLEVRGTINTGSDLTSTLVLQAGTVLRFAPGSGLQVGDDSGITEGHAGRLQATGTTFTSNREVPAPGDWRGLTFANSTREGAEDTVLDGCTVEWAGGGASGAVVVNASFPRLRGIRILRPATAGLWLTGSSASRVEILGGEIEGGGEAAIRAFGSSTLTLSQLTLRRGSYPLRIDPNVSLGALSGNRLEAYPFLRAGIRVDGGVIGGGSVQTRLWPADLPYIVGGLLEVRGDVNTGSDLTSTLAIAPGAELRFEADAGLQIGDGTTITQGHAGRLQASGVRFTANAESPEPGFWRGISFLNTARDGLDDYLTDSLIEHAGRLATTDPDGAGLTIDRSGPRVHGVTVRASSGDGVLVSGASPILAGMLLVGNVNGLRATAGASPQLTGSDIEGNSAFGVRNDAGGTLTASGNWWGHPSGPRGPAGSGFDGEGDAVSAGVDASGFLTASALPPLAPAGLTAAPGDSRVALAWAASPEGDLAGYHVFRRQLPAATRVRLTAAPLPPSPAPSFTDPGLTNTATYCYQLQALDGQGRESPFSREVCATPKVDTVPPFWPQSAGAQLAEGGDGQVALHFEPAQDLRSPVVTYSVYWSLFSPVDRGDPTTDRLLGVTAAAGTAGFSRKITVGGLLNGRTYHFNLQAVDGSGNEDGNAVEVAATPAAGAGAAVESAFAGAVLDGVTLNAAGEAVLAAGASEGRLTTAVLELPAGTDLAAVAWNAVLPAGTAVDSVAGGAATVEVRAAADPGGIAAAACFPRPASLQLFWPGEGNSREVLSDARSVARGGLRFVPAGDARARLGGAFLLPFGSFAEVEANVSESAYTASLWFRTTCPDCGILSVDAGSLGASGHDRHLFLSGGRLCARVWSNETICTAGSSWADDRWHHLVHVFGGAVGGQKLFVDGAERASGAKAASDFSGQTGVNLGFSNDAAFGFFAGSLDEVAIFDAALSPAEIAALFAAPGGLCLPDGDGDGVGDLADACPGTPQGAAVTAAGCRVEDCFAPAAPGPAAWWPADGDAADRAGSAGGTLGGGAGFAPGRVNAAAGGQAFAFDGVDDRVQVPSFGSFTRGTLSAWVYRSGRTGARESIVSYKEGDSPNCGFLLSVNEDGASQQPRQFVQVNGTWRSVVADEPLAFGRWVHLAGTYDGSLIRLYADGVLVAEAAWLGAITQCTQATGIGSRASFDRLFFPGRLDEVMVWDRALAPQEVAALAGAGEAGLCTAPPAAAGPPGSPQVEAGWVPLARAQTAGLPAGRYVQVRVTLRGAGGAPPRLRSLSLAYAPGGGS